MSAPLAFLSLLIELFGGYPDRLVRAIGHPVIWIGKLISSLDHTLNRQTASAQVRRVMGVIALVVLVAIPAAIAWVAEAAFALVPLGIVGTALLGSSLLAQRSLATHVKAVADALGEGGVVAGVAVEVQ